MPFLYTGYQKYGRYKTWAKQQKAYKRELSRLRDSKKQLNVVFMVLYSSVWKYDSVYKLMEKDSRFNPLILVCPIADYGKEHMNENYRPTVEMFKRKARFVNVCLSMVFPRRPEIQCVYFE